MRQTRCVRATLPQAVYNPKYKQDPRQHADPEMLKVVMRRNWVARKWKVGEEPWEMDPNAERDFSKRNLADDYADVVCKKKQNKNLHFIGPVPVKYKFI